MGIGVKPREVCDRALALLSADERAQDRIAAAVDYLTLIRDRSTPKRKEDPRIVPVELFRPSGGGVVVCGSHIYGDRDDRRQLYLPGRVDSVLGVDLVEGPGVDLVADLESPEVWKRIVRKFGDLGHVDCVSVLEHSRRPWVLAQNIEASLGDCGTLLLSVPCVWRTHGYPTDYWRFLPDGVRALFPRISWEFLRIKSGKSWYDTIPHVKEGDETGSFRRSEVVGWGTRA